MRPGCDCGAGALPPPGTTPINLSTLISNKSPIPSHSTTRLFADSSPCPSRRPLDRQLRRISQRIQYPQQKIGRHILRIPVQYRGHPRPGSLRQPCHLCVRQRLPSDNLHNLRVQLAPQFNLCPIRRSQSQRLRQFPGISCYDRFNLPHQATPSTVSSRAPAHAPACLGSSSQTHGIPEFLAPLSSRKKLCKFPHVPESLTLMPQLQEKA